MVLRFEDAGWLYTAGGEAAVSNLARRKRHLDGAMLEELRKADLKAELEPWRLHNLRHTLKTWMQQARIPNDVRNGVQNHYDGDMDELYGPYSFGDEKLDAFERCGGHARKIVEVCSTTACRAGP